MKNDLVQDVKDRVSIEDVVADYVELKRSGRNLKALSPFSAEKTASFMVSPEKQIWHDFSSGKGGNMFGFVMDIEGIDFKAALDILAKKAGLDPAEYRRGGSSGMDKRRKRSIEALDAAAKFYQTQLVSNKKALDYVTGKRGLNKESITNFRVGYSPNSKDALCKYLMTKGFDPKEIKDSGLASQRSSGNIDMFRGRMMLPLMDPQGQVIGFTARLIEDQPDSPKYINTPQTVVYDKSRHVFGFSQAKDAIRRAGYVVITEGNLDVVSSHKSGVRQVVATAGTAMTIHHLKIVSRVTNDIRLAFDADDAGIKATERTIELSQELDVKLSIVSIPDGQDPDDLVRSDLAAWQEVIAKPEYAVDWVYKRHQERIDTTSASGKREFTDIVLRVVRGLKDEVEKDHYMRLLAKDMDISLDAVKGKLDGLENQPIKPKKRLKEKPAEDGQLAIDPTVIEDKFVGLLIMSPMTRRLSLTTEQEILFSRPGRQAIYDYLMSNPQANIDDLSPPEELREHADYVKLAVFTAEEHYRDLDSNERLREASDLANRLIQTSYKNRIMQLTAKMEAAQESGDNELVQKLLKEVDVIIKSQG